MSTTITAPAMPGVPVFAVDCVTVDAWLVPARLGAREPDATGEPTCAATRLTNHPDDHAWACYFESFADVWDAPGGDSTCVDRPLEIGDRVYHVANPTELGTVIAHDQMWVRVRWDHPDYGIASDDPAWLVRAGMIGRMDRYGR